MRIILINSMKTRICRIDSANISENIIKEAGEVIRQGGLVAFPTETVYGLGGDAFNPESSRKIYAAKGRPSDNPLIVHIAGLEDIEKLTGDISDQARRLMDAYWPGPLTIIFRKKKEVPDETTGGLDTVAVRFPSDPVAQRFIEAAGGFVAAPSANISGRPSPTNGKYVVEDMDGRIDMILYGDDAEIGLESTIVDATEEIPVILRPGFITEKMIEEVCGSVDTDKTILSDASGIAPKAPGMKYRHYAPKGQLAIVEGDAEEVINYINSSVKKDIAEGLKTGVIATDETGGRYSADLVLSAGARNRKEQVAHRLFSILREFDDEGIEKIYSESFADDGLGTAVMNRLLKAAGHNVVNV